MTKCGGCGRSLTGGATCTKCKIMYHKQCVSLSSNAVPKSWLCPVCVVQAPRRDNTNTPLKHAEEERSEKSPQTVDDCGSEQASSLLLEEIRALRKDMSTFSKDFLNFKSDVRAELKELRSTFQGSLSEMTALSERLDTQEARLSAIEASAKNVEDLELQIRDLKRHINSREQLSLQNDIEISGVTEHKGENIMHVTGLILNKIGLSVDERDIVESRRVGPVHLDHEGKQRPRPIVLRVTRRAVHEQVIRGARARRNISTGDIAVAGTPRPIYINERLTKDTRLLFGRTRALCKQHKWKYAWTREGKILVREGDSKPAFRVRDEADLERIFKSHSAHSASVLN